MTLPVVLFVSVMPAPLALAGIAINLGRLGIGPILARVVLGGTVLLLLSRWFVAFRDALDHGLSSFWLGWRARLPGVSALLAPDWGCELAFCKELLFPCCE
jgi:hypothetical protein